jgi:PAS domain S-box-containing protein
LSRAASSSRRVYSLYFLATAIVAALIFADTALILRMQGLDEGSAKTIRAIGDQRARGQHIALLVTRLAVVTDPAERSPLAAKAEQALDGFEQTHRRLLGLNRDAEDGNAPFSESYRALGADIRAFHRLARDHLAGAVTAGTAQHGTALFDQADALDRNLEALSNHYAADTAARVRTLERGALAAGGLSLLVLLGLGGLVIRPLARRIDQFIREETRARVFTEAVVDTIADGIITMDGRGVIRSFSRGAERIFGHTSRDVVGRHIGILMPDEDARAHDGYVERWRRTGVSRVLGRPHALTARRQTGETFPVELIVTHTRIDGEDLFVGICRDVTAQRAAEQALLWSRRALDATPNLFFVLSRDHRYVFSNRAHREATDPADGDVIGRHIRDVRGQAVYDDLLRPSLDQAFAGEPVVYDVPFTVPGAARRMLSVTYLPLEEETGAIEHVLVMALDVTDRTQQFKELNRQRKALGLINAISSRHDADPSALLRDALDQVTRHLGMAVGLIGRADHQHCTILYRSGSDGLLREGQSFRSGTFPARIRETGDVVAIDRIDPDEDTERPFGPDVQPCSYIGAPLVVAGIPRGTVSFLSLTARSRPFDEADKELVRLFGYWVQSQLERMQAQDALARSEERLRRSQDFADIGTWDWAIESGDLYWSDRIAPLFGYRKGELATSYDNFLNAVHPDDREMVTAAVAACLETGAPYDIEHRVVWPDGTVRWLSEKGDAVRDDTGRAVNMLGVVQDITRRRTLEDQLRQFRQVVEETALGVGIGTPDGTIVYVNAAHERIFAMSRDDLIGRHFTTLHPDADPGDMAMVANAIRQGEHWHGLLTARDGNGRSFPLNCSVGALKDETGQVLVAFNIMEDYSAEMERQRQLRDAKTAAEAANTAKSVFLSQMSHELRTPLNAIIGFSQLLQMAKSAPLSDRQAQYVGHIRESGEHLLALINDILDFAKIDVGMLSLTLEPVSLSDVTRESLTFVHAVAEAQGLELTAVAIPEDLYVHADRTRLKQVLVNLLSNAIKYNKPNGAVDLSIETRDGDPDHGPTCRVAVRDTGLGLTPDQIGHLFEPFNRLGAEALGIDGTGIGLVLSRQLVEAMNGRLGMDSTPGEGSTFWVDLNVAAPVDPSPHGDDTAPR